MKWPAEVITSSGIGLLVYLQQYYNVGIFRAVFESNICCRNHTGLGQQLGRATQCVMS